MPRLNRIHAPSSIFHITARTQAKAPWFTDDVKTEIASTICDAARMSDTWPLAFTVMSNHLHIVARQGNQPLGWFMQRVLQRAAFVVKKRHQTIDHVFGKRYWAGICGDPFYARQCIVYTHLNAFYAGLCAHPNDYRWTSHTAFAKLRQSEWRTDGFCDQGLGLFADESLEDASSNYTTFINYWMTRERLPLGVKFVFQSSADWLSAPRAPFGDEHWQVKYGRTRPFPSPEQRMPISDCAVLLLHQNKTAVSIDQLRTAGRIRRLNEIRREVTASLVARGYRNGAIARCLCVSPAYVSRVAAEVRSALIGASDAREK